jgi:HK97 family phage major capsid protein/HK97 family phage prohead protease
MRPPANNPFLSTRNDPDAMLHRVAELDRAAINDKDRTVEIAFSSEAPVERYFGTEVLGHEATNVRLGRLNNGGAVLVEHDRRDQVGVVVKASIDKDRKGRATIRFGKSARAEEIFQDVKDGIRRLVSVGYRIHKQETKNEAGGVESVRVTDWEPFELSLVSIPADDSVGVGRGEPSADEPNQSLSEIKSMNREQIIARLRALNIAFDESASTDALRNLLPEAERNAAPVNTPTAPVVQRAAETPAAPRVEVTREATPSLTQEDVTRGITAERTRVSTIGAIAAQARNQGLVIDENRAIAEGLTADAFRNQVFDALVARNTPYQPGNASRQESRDIGRFDLGVAIRSLVNGTPLTGIEREMIQEGQREAEAAGLGVGPGLTLPSFLVRQTGQRDMTTTAAEGGHTIATQKMGLLDDFFNASVMASLGATVLTGLTQNVDLPRLTAGTAPAKKAENGGADEVTPATAMLSLSPKRLPAFINLSQQLLMQSSVAIESMIRGHLTNQMLAVQEAAFFHGGGTQEATGIAATGSIGSVLGGAAGAAPTYAHMISLEAAVDTTNALGGNLRYATNGQVRAKLKGTPKQASGIEGNFIISDLAPDVINGYRAGFTNAISRTLVKGGSGAVCSAIFFGNFSDYIIGYWGGLQLELLRDSTNAKLGQYTLVANTYYDGGVVRPKSFAAMLDALAA